MPLIWRMVFNARERESAEKKLGHSESKFRHLVESLPDATVVLVDIVNHELIYRHAQMLLLGIHSR